MHKLSLSVLALAALTTSPALAHDEGHHGLPGAMHALSADHAGWVLLAGAVLLVGFALARPVLRALKVRSRR